MTQLFTVLLAVQTAVAVPAVLEDRSFTSEALGRRASYRVLLPGDYPRSARRYPVLYLLHGLTGTYKDWGDRTRLLEHLADLELIVVMPDAGDSWYVNAGDERYEDYVALDLVKEVERQFRAQVDRAGRSIAGLSMGGYGAFKIALRHPARFAVAGSFSGAFSIVRDGRRGEWFRDPAAFGRIFGPPGSPRRIENDVYELVRRADPKKLPYFYLDCGRDDFLLRANRDLVALLQQRGIAYEYHEVAGAHSWEYWNRRLPEFLRILESQTVE
jgi:S-formylglutathione hydrolase FrmB